MKTTIVRRLFAALSAGGAGICVAIYIRSLAGVKFDATVELGMALGAIALSVPIALFESRSLESKRAFWRDAMRALPAWARGIVTVFWLVAIAHFVWFFFSGHRGVPTIKDGQFIIDSHGRIIKVLTEHEYWALKGEEVRSLASLMVAVYLNAAMNWWFPIAKRKAAAA